MTLKKFEGIIMLEGLASKFFLAIFYSEKCYQNFCFI